MPGAVGREDDVVNQWIDWRNEEHTSGDRLPPSGHNDETGQAEDSAQPEAGQGKGFGEAVRKPKLDNTGNGESLEPVRVGSNPGEGIVGVVSDGAPPPAEPPQQHPSPAPCPT